MLGSDGLGDSTLLYDDSFESCVRNARSDGAGEDILLFGKSILAWLATLAGPCSNVNWPSFVFRL